MNPWPGIVSAYLASRRARGDLSPSTRRTARYLLGDLADRLGAISPWADAVDLADAVTGWADRPAWSPRTRSTNLGYARPFLEWAAARRRMTAGVASMIRNPRRPKGLPRALNTTQVGTLLDVVPDERARAVVLLEGQCGLRRAEVARLTLADVDLVEGVLRIVGKGDKVRMVYPSDETLDAIRALLLVRGGDPGALICHERHPGRAVTPTWIGVLVARWMTDAGLKAAPGDGVSGHALRHSTATNMLRAGADIRVVQEALGHESITTTAMYLRVDSPQVRAAMRAVNYGTRRLRPVANA